MSGDGKSVTTSRDTLLLQYIVKLKNIEEEKNDLDTRKAYLIADLAERLLAQGYTEEETVFSLLCTALKNTVDVNMIERSLPDAYIKKSITSKPQLQEPDVQDKIKMRMAHKIVTYDNLLEEVDVLKKQIDEDTIRINELTTMIDGMNKSMFKQDRIIDRVFYQNTLLQKRLQKRDPPIYIEVCNVQALFLMMQACIKKERQEPKFNPTGERNRLVIFDMELSTGEVTGCHLAP